MTGDTDDASMGSDAGYSEPAPAPAASQDSWGEPSSSDDSW